MRGSTEIESELRDARARLREVWTTLGPTARRAASRGGRGPWTPVEVLDHLARTQTQVVRLTRGLWDGRPEALPPRPGGDPSRRLDAYGVTDRSRRVDAPDFALPRPGRRAEECWAELDAGLESLVALAHECGPWDVSSLRLPHPALGPLDLHQWLLFAAHHERRHAEQMQGADGTTR